MFCLFVLYFFCDFSLCLGKRSFIIDYYNNQFLKDGQPYRYISGSIHYFRIPNEYWVDRLTKIKAAGLNAIQFYIPWNLHEPTEGNFYFEQDADLLKFLRIAQSLELDVILRLGPYVCGEWEAGGFPWWLLKIPDLHVRTFDRRFLYFVNKWYTTLLPMLVPYLHKNGGPVIMMQLENEYGSRDYCDRNYTLFLRDYFRDYVGDDFILITDDGGDLGYLKCGFIPGVYPTVDFGTDSKEAVGQHFAAQRTYAPKGPLVNSEFYPGWLDLWGGGHSVVQIQPILDTMQYMYDLNASFNFYMFEGGTNFGYMNGAGTPHLPVTTSYDYDAPLTEAGDPTPKYFAIRTKIANLTKKSITTPVPPPTKKVGYGTVQMMLLGAVTNLVDQLCLPDAKVKSRYPLSFEQLDFPYGFVLYEVEVKITEGPSILYVPGINDRGYIMVDGQYMGLVTVNGPKTLKVTTANRSKVQILVENNARHTSGIPDPKGIIGDVTLNETILTDWIMYPLTIDYIFDYLQDSKVRDSLKKKAKSKTNSTHFAPSIYFSKFSSVEIADTYFHPGNWSKGQLFMNFINVGRYWPSAGPQVIN